MLIRCVTDAIDLIAVLVKSGNLRDGSVVQVQFVSIGCDEHAVRVVPGTLADAITGAFAAAAIDLGAQVGAPGPVACADGRGERLAVGVGASQAAEVGSVTDSRGL